MQRWLFKSEPSCYSIADLERDSQTVWNGISNAMARIHLRRVEPGDLILFYHTGNVRAVVGVMKANSGPMPDADSDDEKAVAVQVSYIKAFREPVSLDQIRKEKEFATSDLLRQTRLSVLPVTEKQWQRIEQLAGESKAKR